LSKTRNRLLAALVIVIPALLLMPLDRRIEKQRRELKYGGMRMTREMRDQIGQGMAIGLLAGFRGVVADFLWIQAHAFWEKHEWLRQYRNMQLVTFLQPQSTMFWDTGAWHMAWNIGYAVSVDPSNATHAVGLMRQREWWDKAKEFLERGIENVPNQYELYFSLGWLYMQKYKDPCRAAEQFSIAASFPDAPTYVERLYARNAEQCGFVQEAYADWKRIWNEDHSKVNQPWSSVEREIRRLENELNIPEKERVFPKSAPSPSPSKKP
jgi:hypothetical protein